ncbi:transglycosylase SLT domain-containing protein, partial [Tetragenococcus halophilus]|uniref:transglycosylase SLT domain-containing protein n=2 Tax=Tetragenococcus halophilus TaxID=51669 RepID=UPI0030C9A4B5
TQAADEIAKGAEKMGVSTDFYQESAYWASQNGISQEQMEKAVGRLNQRMGQAVDGNEKYAEALEKLGVDLGAVEDGSLSTEDAMAQSITTLSEMDNENEKAALATEMFGTRMARDLLPALNDGSLSMEEAREKAQELGLVMGGEQLEKAEEFQDSMDDVKRSLSAVGMEIGLELMPYFQQMLDWIIDHMPQIRETITGAFDTVMDKAHSLYDWWTDLSDGTKRLIGTLGGVAAAMGPFLMVFGRSITFIGNLMIKLGPLLQAIGRAGGLFKWLGGILGGLASPAALIIGGIVGLGTAFVVAYKKSESFRNFIGGIGSALSDAVGWVKDFAGAIKNLFQGDLSGGISILESLGLSPNQISGVMTAVDQVKSTINTLKDYVSQAFGAISDFASDMFQKIKSFWDSDGKQVIEAVKNAISGMHAVVSAVMPAIQTIISVVFKGALAIVKSVWNNIKGIISGALNVIMGVIQVFSGIFTGDFSKMWEGIKNIFSGAIKVIWNWISLQFIGRLLKGFTGLAGSAGGLIKGMWRSIRGFFSNGIQGAINLVKNFGRNISNRFTQLQNGAANIIKTMWNSIRNFFVNGIKNTFSRFIQFVKNLIARFRKLKSDGKNIISGMWSSIRKFFSDSISNVVNRVLSFVRNIKNRFLWVKNQARDTIRDMWDGIRNTFSNGIDTIVKWMKDLPGNIADGIKRGKNAVANAFKNMFATAVEFIKKPVNAIIGGANWVLDKFGADEIDKWNPDTNYAKGTNGKGHPGGSAMVNDGGGAEAIIPPNGQAFIPRGKNVVFPSMPKGTHVLNAKDTANAYGNGKPKYSYKDGTGIWNKVKDVGGNIWDSTKNIAKAATDKIGDIWDYMSDPGKLVDKVIEHFVDFGDASHFPLWAGKGLVSTAKDKMVDWVQGLFDDYGGFDGSIYKGSIQNANGVYEYLVDIAKKVMDKFPGMTGVTSGYRPGDPNHHGKHQAIDIAYPASMNGSTKYTEAGNWAFSHFPDQLAYVIANNKIKDRTGMGGEGVTNSWKNWPSGGHLNHMHLSGKYGPGDVGKGGDGFDGGSGVGRWKKTAIKALNMTGDYTKSNLSALMAQMKAESNGNPKAVNNWDSNAARGTPSKGLMQMIQPTFDSYKMKGHGDILKPLDNILAAILYTKSAYGSLKSGWRGAGYENGGLVSRHQIAEMGEGNKPEMVLPLTNKARSLDLMAKAMQIMGVDDKNASSSSSFSLSVVTELLQ